MPAFYSNDLAILEESLSYTFENKELLLEAITHSSYHHEYPEKMSKYNERLEFLGDAVFGLAISETLFNEKSSFNESEMSKLKSYIVSRSTLSKIAREINLGRYINLGKGEEMTGGREKSSLLANTLEAVFGAIFIDSDYNTAKPKILFLYSSILKNAFTNDILYDFKTRLQEESQTLFGKLPEYRLVKESGVDHNKTFTYDVYIEKRKYGTGRGRSKKAAQSDAAQMALENLTKSKIENNDS